MIYRIKNSKLENGKNNAKNREKYQVQPACGWTFLKN